MEPSIKRLRFNFSMTALLLNGAFWVYFWARFASASLPNDGRHCVDHCLDPYVFFGRGIGFNFNPLALPFMKLMIWVQLLPFTVATLLQNMLPGQHSQWLLFSRPFEHGFKMFTENYDGSGGRLFLGISMTGYRLLSTMLLSFVQWILIARFLSWTIQKFRKNTLKSTPGGTG